MRATIAHAASRIVDDGHRRATPAHRTHDKPRPATAKSPVVRNLVKVRNALVRLAN
jgi:hypothetical protein